MYIVNKLVVKINSRLADRNYAVCKIDFLILTPCTLAHNIQ